jgi:hypothetical protein
MTSDVANRPDLRWSATGLGSACRSRLKGRLTSWSAVWTPQFGADRLGAWRGGFAL